MGILQIQNGGSRQPRSPVVRRRPNARAVHGSGGLLAAGYPTMGMAVCFALGLVAAHGLGMTPIAVAVAGVVVAVAVLSHLEGISMYPEAGTSATFARNAFGELAGFAAGWAAALAALGLAAIAALFVPHYLSPLWAPLAHRPADLVGAVVVLVLVAAGRARGVDRAPGVDVFAGCAAIVLQVLLVILGATLILHPRDLGADLGLGSSLPSAAQMLLAVALATAAFTGAESIFETAEHAADPVRSIRTSVRGLLASAVALACALALVALAAMPVYLDPAGHPTTRLAQPPPAGDAAYPLLGIASALPLHVFSKGVEYLVGLLVAAILVLVTGSALGAAVRLVDSLARHSQLPSRMAVQHHRDRTPGVAVVLSACGAGVLLAVQEAWGGPGLLAGAYVYGAMLVFTAVQVAIVALRGRDPLRYRPFRVPLNLTIRGRSVPAPAVLGAVATAAVWVAMVVLDPAVGLLGTAWMAAGLAGYAAYRRRLGLGLAETRRCELPDRIGPDIEVEFHTTLIPINTDQPDIPTDVVEVAARMAAERRASIVLVAFTEIPLGEDLDLEIDGLDETVSRIAARVRSVTDRYGIRVHVTHLRTRDPVESILEEADRRHCEIILIGSTGLHRARYRLAVNDATVGRIATEARQRVMIVQPAVQPA